jgi:glycosyltransferase involved in cell wall biosynthesis
VLSFSIVTPSLNHGAFIQRTMCSVLNQGYGLFEYVVCDGGSTDETLGIVARFGDQIRLLPGPDSGQSNAVNRGMQATSGEVIGWLNSDDVYRPGALARVAEELATHPDVDVVYGDADLIDADDRPLGRYRTEPWRPERLPHSPILCQPAVFFRRRVVERFGPLDEKLRYCMDYEYWLRLAEGGAQFAYVPVVLASSRIHPETKTQRDRLAIHAELNTMLRRRLGHVPASWLLNHAHTQTELNRQAGKTPPVPFAVEAAARALALSWQWNHAISTDLIADISTRLTRAVQHRLTP